MQNRNIFLIDNGIPIILRVIFPRYTATKFYFNFHMNQNNFSQKSDIHVFNVDLKDFLSKKKKDCLVFLLSY